MANCYCCPFFKRNKGEKIYCEIAAIKPPDQQTKKEVEMRYCANETNYKNCTFYKLLDAYYDRKYSHGEEEQQ
jgi:hypothetical protein